MLRKNLLVLVALLTLAGMILAACQPATQAPTEAPATEAPAQETEEATPEPTPEPQPKTLVVCQGQEPETLYIYGGSMLAARHIQQAVYDGPIDNRTYAYQPVILQKLPSIDDGDAVINKVTVQAGDMVVDDNGDPVELAEGVKIRPAGCRSSDCAVEFDGNPVEMDQMVVTFKMLEGLKWSDGEPLTADDSVYSFEVAADPDTPSSKSTIQRTASYEATDDVTVVWTGLPGYIDSTYFTNFWNPLPRHLWQEQLGYSAADLLEAEESSRMPMGWGAFIIKEWVAGDHITVEKNPNYFRADEGLPYVDTVIFRFVSDANAAVAQLVSGECDIVTQDASLDDQAELLLKLEDQGVVKPVFLTGTVWEHVDFCIKPVESYDRPDFFSDVRMRHAIAYCLDRQSVVDSVLYGRSTVIDSYIPPEHPLYAGDRLVHYDYDPEKGMALLEEMGWIDEDGDGVREAHGVEGIPDGTPLEFKWQSTTASLRVQYMQIFQQNLADCGIKVNLENLPAAEYFADGPEGPLFGRHFDLGSFAWLTGVEPPCDLYLSEGIPGDPEAVDENGNPLYPNGWGGWNDTGFSDPEYDAACKRALQALPGTEDYIEGHKESQRIFSEQLPVVPLFLRLKIAATRPEVTGFIMDPTENSEMWNIEAFDIQTP